MIYEKLIEFISEMLDEWYDVEDSVKLMIIGYGSMLIIVIIIILLINVLG